LVDSPLLTLACQHERGKKSPKCHFYKGWKKETHLSYIMKMDGNLENHEGKKLFQSPLFEEPQFSTQQRAYAGEQ